MKLLIATTPDDAHAHIIQHAMQELGHKVTVWYTAKLPQGQAHTLYLDGKEPVWLSDISGDPVLQAYDVAWYRRPCYPKLANTLHADDIDSAKKENTMFFQALWQFVLPDAIWINPPNTVTRVNAKLLQLKIAKKMGMNIPKTIVSNCPAVIKDFIRHHASVVYKTLYPLSWITENKINLTYTSQVELADLPSDHLLKSVPGIYQEKVHKQYELRVTYFGSKYIAVKIHSQAHDLAKSDWRAAPTRELTLEQVRLPDNIDKACQHFMAEFGIIFGCFDFIVTEDNQYYFLEVNEQGQFLWIEEVNPNIKMLDAFVKFLLSFDKEKRNYQELSLLDYHQFEPCYAEV